MTSNFYTWEDTSRNLFRNRTFATNGPPTANMVDRSMPDNTMSTETRQGHGAQSGAGRAGEVDSSLPSDRRQVPYTRSGKTPIDFSKLVASKRKPEGGKDRVSQKPERKRAKGDGGNVATLNRLGDLIDQCLVANNATLEEAYDSLRDHLHALEYVVLNINAVKMSTALTDRGLKRCFNGQQHNFPADIKADAQMLYNKWIEGKTDCDIMRNLEYTGSKERRSMQLVRNQGDYKKTPSFYGEGHLVNGMWWPCQLAALRDGAHGHPVAGIAGDKNQGAYSVVMSGSDYEDVDQGDEVGYTGTRSSDGSPTTDTMCMKASLRRGNPVRVLRTSKLSEHNEFRPAEGYRYDGLYTVVDEECIDRNTHHWRFHLRRIPGQDEIRNKGNAKRPTRNDLIAYRNHHKLSK